MRRGTTPTHTFEIGVHTDDLKELVITYKQNHRTVLEKRLSDCLCDGSTVSVTLTQEETFLFASGANVSIQIRVLTKGGNALASDVATVGVSNVLNSEVLT